MRLHVWNLLLVRKMKGTLGWEGWGFKNWMLLWEERKTNSDSLGLHGQTGHHST